jgi:hypothetical protein
VQQLPRWALFLLCTAYVLPGVFGRDPWRNADVTAFGLMFGMVDGRASWWNPAIGGVAATTAPLPHWLGACFIRLLEPWLDPALAARLPFAALLATVLLLTWLASYHLARSEAAQPVPFAFGGEAVPADYARAIADGALLALIASLGLLQLGHETTPELAQLACVSLFIYALAASPVQGSRARVAVMIALPALAASGAPSIAVALGLTGALVCARSTYTKVRKFFPWVLLATALAMIISSLMGLWTWQLAGIRKPEQILAIARQWVWFMWPAWPMVLWTLWQWRRQMLHRHIAVPLSCAAITSVASLLCGGVDRVLMLALPALALLAAFALPTFKRSTAAAIDWFSVFFFTVCAIVIWEIYVALQTGMPAPTARNVIKLAPGFASEFSAASLTLAAAGSLAWLWLVRWRTGRNQHALWKSLVLPASGVALCWLLLMTLMLPLVDYARSFRPLVSRIAKHVPLNECISAPKVPRSLQASLEYFGPFQIDGASGESTSTCKYMIQIEPRREKRASPTGWVRVARESLPTDRTDWTVIYRRDPAAVKPKR